VAATVIRRAAAPAIRRVSTAPLASALCDAAATVRVLASGLRGACRIHARQDARYTPCARAVFRERKIASD